MAGHPATVLGQQLRSAFGREFDKVLLLLVDGFGWRFFEQYSDTSSGVHAHYPVLSRFAIEGLVRKFSSQFPSTTAAHITTLHTGLPVGEHGVFEWQYYETQVDALVAPLMFSYAGTRTRDELKKEHVDPRPLLPGRTLYQKLATLGIRSAIFQHREYTPSTYSDMLFEGATVVPYTTFAEALTRIRAALADPDGPQYLVTYFDKLDFMSHHYGPGSPYFEAETDLFLTALERHSSRNKRAGGERSSC